ncbi:MAG: glycerol-3-phosphate acyltransferase, partial [Pseudomonadota bacterium]|nr:glycerol-3-phosphate acyltransferase [Pseudomonadota bacterium]
MPTEPTSIPLWAALLGYLIGSIPFGLLLTRAAGMGDVRKIGSGNIGATNVLRTGNKGLAAGTLLLDLLKGLAPVLIAERLGGEVAAAFAAGAAVLGHCFPVWLGFKGGKGVATNAGVAFGLAWPVGLAYAFVWLSVLAI